MNNKILTYHLENRLTELLEGEKFTNKLIV